MTLIQIDRRKENNNMYFIITKDMDTALSMSKFFQTIFPNENVTVVDFESSLELFNWINDKTK